MLVRKEKANGETQGIWKFYFSDEVGVEYIRWHGLDEDLKSEGLNIGVVIESLNRSGNFSFEMDGKECRCKVYAVKRDIYTGKFMESIVRFSNDARSKVTSMVISSRYADNIAKGIRVEQTYDDIANVIILHQEISSSKYSVKSFYYNITFRAKVLLRKFRYLIGATIIFVTGNISNSMGLNWDTVEKILGLFDRLINLAYISLSA